MRVTIIRVDAAVYKDGVCYLNLDVSSVPLNVHALQWYDTFGHIEYVDAPNMEITELPDWANVCLAEWDAANYAHNNPPLPTTEELLSICKAKARNKLELTDYSELPDVAAILVNKDEFTTYRTQIRELFLNPVVDPVWPPEPKAVWATA